MGNLNSFSGIVKLLETPKQFFNKKRMKFIKFHAEIPQNRRTSYVEIIFWGNLSDKIQNFYKKNDYILIEGYISSRIKRDSNQVKKSSKIINITGLKVYPVMLSSNHNDSSNC